MHDVDRGPLGDDVDRFINAVSTDLGELSGRTAESHRNDVTIEAANLMAAAFEGDDRLTDDEAWAYVFGVGSISEPALIATPEELRSSDVLKGKTKWATTPSVLFDLLARADVRDHAGRSHRYHDLALRLWRGCISIDLVTSTSELDLLETFRQTMLTHFDVVGVGRPGQPRHPLATNDQPTRSGPATGGAQPPKATAEVAPAAAAATDKPLPPARSIGELIAELDALVGLKGVKDEINRLTSLLQIQQLRAERGLPTIETSHHLVFTGNPGTGKTTVARLLSQIYRSLGVVNKGQLIETDRSSLVAGFVGQTATKTMAVLHSALGGMLLIDEAYSLARGGSEDFGREAIDTLVKFMEDHRDDLGVVAAGYPTEMQDFIDTNPGLKSRFTRTVHFADYTDDELTLIFERLGEKGHYRPSSDAVSKLRAILAAVPRDRGFGNARLIRNIFEESVGRQAQRLSGLSDPNDEQLTTIIADDLPAVGTPL